MPDPDLAARNIDSGVAKAASRRSLNFVKRNWDLVGVLLLALATMPVSLLSPKSLVIVGEPNPLDDSWILDTSFKAFHGIWLSRDVAFTYGPVFQWLSSAPARFTDHTMGTVYTTWNLLPLWCSYLLIWGTIRLLLPEQPGWKRLILFLLLCMFWFPPDLRAAASIFLFTLFTDQWYRLGSSRIRPWAVGGLAAALCTIAFLISADTGVYAVAAFVISLLGVAAGERLKVPTPGQLFTVVAAFSVALAGLVLVVNSALFRLADFRFWKTSFAIISGYRWMEASQMAKAGKTYIVSALIVGAMAFLLRFFGAAWFTGDIAKRSGFLLGAFAFAMLRLQSGLVRSDIVHVALSTFAMTLFVGSFLFAIRSRVGSVAGVLLAVALSWTLGQRDAGFLPSNIVGRYRQALHPQIECPAGASEFSRVCFPTEFAGVLQNGVRYLQQHSGSQQPVVLFPFQNMFGVSAERDTAGGVLQSYLASGNYLSNLDIQGFARQDPPAGLYFPDGQLSDPVDGVSNFTRSPEVWFWIVQHYRADTEVAPGITGLVRDESRATRISQESQTIGVSTHIYPISKRSSLFDLGDVTWPAGGADFLWLKVNVRYPMTWKLRKPQRLQLEISRSDGSVESRSFLAIPNVSSEIWIYPWYEDHLSRYFASDAKLWGAGVPAITHLKLWVTPLDWVSQVPNSITVEDARAVRLVMRP